MNNLKSEIKIMHELRPCEVKGRKALFHGWHEASRVVPPSPMVGGHNGGEIKFTVAIIEWENGTVTECYPREVKFLDSKVEEYYQGNKIK